MHFAPVVASAILLHLSLKGLVRMLADSVQVSIKFFSKILLMLEFNFKTFNFIDNFVIVNLINNYPELICTFIKLIIALDCLCFLFNLLVNCRDQMMIIVHRKWNFKLSL